MEVAKLLRLILFSGLLVVSWMGGCESKNPANRNSKPDSNSEYPRLEGTPQIQPSALNAGDSVQISLSASNLPEHSAVVVYLLDSLRTDVLRVDSAVNPDQELISGDGGSSWEGSFEISMVAVTGSYHLEVYLIDLDLDLVTVYLLDPDQSDSVYVLFDVDLENDTVEGPTKTSISLSSSRLDALSGTANYFVTVMPNDFDSDYALEISPQTASPEFETESENDGSTLVYDVPILKIALVSGQSYYVRAVDRSDIGMWYSIAFSASQYNAYLGDYPGGADAYEPDDSAGEASPLILDEIGQAHTFDPVGETDWFLITAP